MEETDSLMKMYQPIPVDAARRIAHECRHDVVVIVSLDRRHSRINATTYGVTPADKHCATKLGLLLSGAAGQKSVGSWNAGEPPHDRPVVIIGSLVSHDEEGGDSQPVSARVAQWSEKSNDWLDEYGITIRNDIEQTLVIHHWQDLPAGYDAPEVTVPAMFETLSDGSRILVQPLEGEAA